MTKPNRVGEWELEIEPDRDGFGASLLDSIYCWNDVWEHPTA